jgi:hypothetical protein
VPVPHAWQQLGAARAGEGSSFAASPGASALTTGLVQAAWVLRELRQRRLADAAATEPVFLDWEAFTVSARGLFLWEAIVTGKAKAGTHAEDAGRAVELFVRVHRDPTAANAVTAENPLSLIGAAALWAGWSDDLALLSAPSLVLKALPPVEVA